MHSIAKLGMAFHFSFIFILLLLPPSTALAGIDLQKSFDRIHAEATILAGEPEDIPQRVAFLYPLFQESGWNHAFPLVALHGALWGYDFFEVTGTLGEVISWRYFYDSEERQLRQGMLNQFATRFKDANRTVFIDNYTNFHFSKRFGTHPGALKFIDPALLAALNRMHDATSRRIRLMPAARRNLFILALMQEQEVTVAPKVEDALERFDCPILKNLSLKPWVHFSYFPNSVYFRFKDFSDKEERIRWAIASYDLAEKMGFPEVVKRMDDYGILPKAFVANPSKFAEELKNQLLSGAR